MIKASACLFLALGISLCANQKNIVIDLGTQTLIAKEGKKTIFSTKVSTGMYGFETPPGTFKIFAKHKTHFSTEYPKREFGEDGGAPMPYTMKITKSGIAIHEGRTRIENGVSVPLSHGCIRVNKKQAKRLFVWATMQTKVTIVGKTTYKDRLNTELKEEYYAHIPQRYSDEYGDWSEVSDDGPLVYDESYLQ